MYRHEDARLRPGEGSIDGGVERVRESGLSGFDNDIFG